MRLVLIWVHLFVFAGMVGLVQAQEDRQESKKARATSPSDVLERAKKKPVAIDGDHTLSFLRDNQRYWVVAGNVVVSSEDFVLHAKNVVLWIDNERYEALLNISQSPADDLDDGNQTPGQILPLEMIQEIYADEDIIFTQGDETVHADRFHYDFLEHRALFINGQLKASANLRGHKLPLYLRAEEIRQRSRHHYSASDAFVSNCGFGNEHLHLRAAEIEVATPEDESSGTRYRARRAIASAWGIPVFYLPRFSGQSGGESALYFKRARGGVSSQFGVHLETEWGDDFRLGGGEEGEKTGDWTVHIDPSEKRGVGLGLDVDYRAPSGFGRFRSYYIHDHADTDRKGRIRDPVTGANTRIPIDEADRARFRLQYRHFLPYEIEGTVEYSWLSDSNFLREYFEREFKQGKEQETIAYLKKVVGNNTFSLLQKNRVNDFLATTEYLPQFEHRLISQPLLPDGLLGTNLYYSIRNRIGSVRNRPSSEEPPEPEIDRERVTRFDSTHQVAAPIDIGPTVFAPFFQIGYSTFSEALDQRGPKNRFTSAGGATLTTQFHRVFNARNRLLKIRDLRHIVNPYISYINRYANTVGSAELIPHDDLESLDKVEFFRFQVRNRLQTRRQDDIAEFLDLDTAINVFPDEHRDNAGRTFGNLENDLRARLGRQLTLLFESEFDFRVDRFDVLNTGVQVKATDDIKARVSYRLHRKRSRVLIGQLGFRFNEKWGARFFERYDFERNDNQDFGVVLQRRACEWIIELSLQRDTGDNDTRFSVNLTPAALYQGPDSNRGAWENDMYLPLDDEGFEDDLEAF